MLRRTLLLALGAALAGPALAQGTAGRRTIFSVRYTSLDHWNRIRRALATVKGVDDVRIDAIGRDGAMVAIQHSVGMEELRTEMRRRGLSLTDESYGPSIRLAGER
jgi:hypothetical protein